MSRRHCYQYLNGAKLRLSDLHNDDSYIDTWFQSFHQQFIYVSCLYKLFM